MPPRHAYWTIIIDEQPTSFRAHDVEELLPTFNRLREKNPTAQLKWFERGQLWDTRDAARAEGFGKGERRWEGPRPDRTWRPGGEHRDPRQKYKDAKKAKWQEFKKNLHTRWEEKQRRDTELPPPEPDRGPGRRSLGEGGPTDNMAAVTYAKDCASCHPLFFDPLIDAVAPHDTPESVHAMVTQSLRQFIAKSPAQIGRPDPVRGRIPVNFPEQMRPVRNATEWIEARTANVERLLWSKTCAECHTIEARTPLPRIVPTNVPAGWMPHARFDHAAHQMTSCTSCHAAATSRLTSDVLMPSIATCQQCHKPSRGAESRCFECHEYHDWKNAKAVKPGFDLHQLVN